LGLNFLVGDVIKQV